MKPPADIKRRILVVDDEPMICDAVEMMLTFDGHTVRTANSGAAALACLENSAFDLVITDYAMPQMKGDELAQRIIRLNPELPIVMITAHAELLRANGTPLPGIVKIVNKPFQLETLREAVQFACPLAA
jgi:two-component system, cell cycle sensor histidine kinase and response regulator CckA